MKRGDIYLCDFGEPPGHEQGWERPALIVSDDRTVEYGLPVILPITRTRRGYPTHVELDGVLPAVCYVQCEQVRVVSTKRLARRVATVDSLDLVRVERVLRRILAL